MSIKSLSKETIKLINSTQVISSIYSAIKELVENSLDAQAQNIEVNLVDNGLSLIEVKDNGVGINRNDAQYMALPSHTSKISNFNDLELLSTYGFRGEGLTSICQVSDVTICTKTSEDETMICYTLDNEGNVVSSELSHGLIGTTVQMKNLFKNMPVRRNILKNKKRIIQEIKAIEILLKTYAICKPSIRITYKVNGNNIFTKPSCKNITEGIQSILGLQIFCNLSYIKKIFAQGEFELFLPKKEIKDSVLISQIGLQFMCVNGRPIKSKEIEKKINKRISEYFQNFSSFLKFIFCLILKVKPSKLDVNLDPNKDKVFLQNEAEILEEIDESLLNFYDLQDSQLSIQSNIENINYNKNSNELKIVNEIGNEKDLEPVHKKMKFNSENENKCNNNNENILNEKQITDDNIIQKNTTNESDNDFLKNILEPVLSDSDSNDKEEFMKKKLLKEHNKSIITSIQEIESDNSEPFTFNKIPAEKYIGEASLSQLPNVDLGEDFDWEEVMIRNKQLGTSNLENNEAACNKQITNVMWSKGQLAGLQEGIVIGGHNSVNKVISCEKENQETHLEESEPFDFHPNVKQINNSEESVSNDSVPILEVAEFDWNVNLKNSNRNVATKKTINKLNPHEVSKNSRKSNTHVDSFQTKIPFAGDNACLASTNRSSFAMYCINARKKILKENPDLTPTEVAIFMNKKWNELSLEEREYYQGLAKQNVESEFNNTSQPYKKVKSQISKVEKEKNKKHLVHMLGNMKMNKTETKNESMIMRSFVHWTISISELSDNFKKRRIKSKRSVVGSLNSLLWIVKLNSNLYIFDISELQSQLKVENFDINKIDVAYVNNLVDQWFIQKNDLSIFHFIHSLAQII